MHGKQLAGLVIVMDSMSMVGFSGKGVVEWLELSTSCLHDANRRMLSAGILFDEVAKSVNVSPGNPCHYSELLVFDFQVSLNAVQVELIGVVAVGRNWML